MSNQFQNEDTKSFYSLSKADISLVVPITNSLTFLFTTLTSRLIGEQQISLSKLLIVVTVF